MTNYIKMC